MQVKYTRRGLIKLDAKCQTKPGYPDLVQQLVVLIKKQMALNHWLSW